jgi:hypothetical protein
VKEKEESQRLERERREQAEEILRKRKEEEMATIESGPLVEHEEITSSVSIPEIDEVILNQLEVEADPLTVPTVQTVEETKEETITPVISTVSLFVFCNSLDFNQIYCYSHFTFFAA